MFIFNDDMISFFADGIIKCSKISVFDAPKTLNNFIKSLSHDSMPFKIVINVTIMLINRALKIIDEVLVPNQIIINGPKATLGRLLRATMNGSRIFFRVLHE